MYLLPGGKQYATVVAGYEYIAVEFEGRASVMALGSREVQGSGPEQIITERWYNAKGEMLVFKNGRIDTALGMAVEWRSNESSPPSWQSVSDDRYRTRWTRTLSIMPGYRFNQTDQVITGRIEPVSVPSVPTTAEWFADEVTSRDREGRPWHFIQRFAVRDQRVVYSEQCLSPQICFKLRPLGLIGKS